MLFALAYTQRIHRSSSKIALYRKWPRPNAEEIRLRNVQGAPIKAPPFRSKSTHKREQNDANILRK